MAKMSEQRKQLGRENYRMLKAAGFTTAEAQRYKFASRENVLKAIDEKALPEIQEKKRTRAKFKREVKKYKNSEAVTIQITSTEPEYLKRVLREMRKYEKKGFGYAAMKATFSSKDEKELTYQTPMIPTKNIQTLDDLDYSLVTTVQQFINAYEPDYIDDQIMMEITFWKPSIKAA